MNENLNLTQVLKGCPKGTKLYSTIYGEVEFIRIDNKSIDYPIDFNTFDGYTISLTSDGRCNKSYDGECTLFPSKDQRDWSKWHRPFVDGDIIADKDGFGICIYKGRMHYSRNHVDFYCGCKNSDNTLIVKYDTDDNWGTLDEKRIATEEDKQKLFDAMSEHGYSWNAEKKVLEYNSSRPYKHGKKY